MPRLSASTAGPQFVARGGSCSSGGDSSSNGTVVVPIKDGADSDEGWLKKGKEEI